MVIIPGLPEIIEVAERKHENIGEKEKAKVTDFSSGIINCAYGIGQGAGPIFSAFFAKNHGFRLTCDTVALTVLIVALIYLMSCQKSTFLKSYDDDDFFIKSEKNERKEVRR